MASDMGGSKPEPKTRCQQVLTVLKNNVLLLCLLMSLILGIGLGAALRTVNPPFTERQIMYLRFPGDLLMNMLKFLIVPLVISSLISGLSSLDTRASGKMGLRAIVYYLTTTFAAVVVGIVLSVSIQPGKRGGDPDDIAKGEERIVNTADTFLDLIRQCFPDNIVEICFKKTVTKQIPRKVEDATTAAPQLNLTTVAMATLTTTMATSADNDTAAPPVETIYDPVLTKIDGMNVLGMVVFSIFFGVILGRMGEKGRALVELFDQLCEAIMKLVNLVIWYSPIGILFLITAKVVEMDDPEKIFQQLLFYFITVIAGLVVHGFGTLPLLYLILVRKNPFKFFYGVLEPLVTAFGTSSSSATLPVTMRCLEENNGVDKRVTKFVAPVGATINMDGTALYEAVAVLFIGQMRGIDMDIGQIITISITATAAAIGAAGVPQAGLVTMVIVLSAVGFPTDDVALVLAVDWLLDRFRTAVNVLGDAYGAGIVAHLSKAELKQMDNQLNAAEFDENAINMDDCFCDSEIHDLKTEKVNQNGHTTSNGGVSNGGFDDEHSNRL